MHVHEHTHTNVNTNNGVYLVHHYLTMEIQQVSKTLILT